MKTLLFLIAMLCGLHASWAQQLSSNNKKAIRLFEEGRSFYEARRNEQAYPLIRKAAEEDASFFEAQILLADLCQDLGKYDEANTAYAAASKLQPDRFPQMYLRWAQSEMMLDLYTQAIPHLEKFLSYPKISEETRKKGERILRNARFAETAIQNPVPFAPENLGKAINSENSEYHPSITVDENQIYYTRLRPADAFTDNGGSKVEEDFHWSIRKEGQWLDNQVAPPPLNSHGNEGAHCLSPDGRFVFFTGCNRPGGLGSCDIYVSEKKGNKWTNPVNLGPAVNSEKWETQPTLSPDGQEIIFVSNRPGGLGGNDLWHCLRQKDGSWSAASNLGAPVNTANDEGGPFLHPDGQTLFFSSNGHAGMGDKDLYSSSRLGSTWTEPRNLGYPINTRGAENYMVVNSTGTTGYISLEREGGFGMQDLYRFDIPASMRPKPVTFLKGVVTSRKNNAPIEARLEIIDLASNTVKARCSSDPVNGSFLISLPAGSSYALNASAEGHLFYSENYTLAAELKATDVFEVNIPLTPIETGEKIVLHNIFFASGSSNLEECSQTEIEILQLFLQRNASLRIEIGGHTDDVGNDAANLKLSQERADAVRSALIAKGIDAGRIVAKGYGETKPVASNQNEAGRAQNRRTEFSIVGK